MNQKPTREMQLEIKTAILKVFSKVIHDLDLKDEWKGYVRRVCKELRDRHTKWQMFTKQMEITTNKLYMAIY